MASEMYGPLARYAARFHATVGDRHHVASPIGAWLLLALCGQASTGAARDELAEVLGTDVESAAAAARALLEAPHPLVPSATAVWNRPGVQTPALKQWLGTLPGATQTGSLPEQARLDAWARDHTLGLIGEFPLELRPETVLLLASALATKVSWDLPFEVTPAVALGADSAWAGRLSTVLRTPEQGHVAYIAPTERAGDVIVHVVSAKADTDWSVMTGLAVVSVAAAPGVSAADVLAAAYEVGQAAIRSDPRPRRSLYDLPLGDYPLWTIREEPTNDGITERHQAVLPAWSARDDHDLTTDALGFPAATRVLAGLLGVEKLPFEARQSTVARYGRYGFEAAAATGFATFDGVPPPGVVRIAELRFGHPYAVLAVAVDHRWEDGQTIRGPWDGVPVFSGWVSEPSDVPPEEAAGDHTGQLT
jgi:hypothetical protein